eukprot:scaffold44985_cov68-Phaeocystis_antarctica.AAC.3
MRGQLSLGELGVKGAAANPPALQTSRRKPFTALLHNSLDRSARPRPAPGVAARRCRSQRLHGEREAQRHREVVRQPMAAFIAQHDCTQPLPLLSAGGVQSLVDEHVVQPKLGEVHFIRVDARRHRRTALRAHVVQRRVEQRLHRRVVDAAAATAQELFRERRGVRSVADDLHR